MIRSMVRGGLLGFAFFVAAGAFVDAAQAQAVRVGAPTSHGGAVLQGSGNVLIGGAPAARVGDFASCPLACPPSTHVGGFIVNGSATVLINGRAAARVGSIVNESCATSTIASGLATVLIGP